MRTEALPLAGEKLKNRLDEYMTWLNEAAPAPEILQAPSYPVPLKDMVP